MELNEGPNPKILELLSKTQAVEYLEGEKLHWIRDEVKKVVKNDESM